MFGSGAPTARQTIVASFPSKTVTFFGDCSMIGVDAKLFIINDTKTRKWEKFYNNLHCFKWNGNNNLILFYACFVCFEAKVLQIKLYITSLWIIVIMNIKRMQLINSIVIWQNEKAAQYSNINNNNDSLIVSVAFSCQFGNLFWSAVILIGASFVLISL